jgi:hypothetical protein
VKGVTLALGGALLAACSSSAPPPADAGPAAWQVVFDGATLDRDLLSAWGTSPTDVYAVGGPLGNSGYQAIVLHYDGASWTELPVGGSDSFWWVYGSGPTDVWMVGENGRMTHWDGAAFTEHTPVTTGTLYGVWAASPVEAWAVGGTPEGGTSAPNDIVLHWDGTSWTPSPLPQQLGRALLKVWGTAPDNLYVVGEYGTIWHRRGATWTLESNPPLAQGTLFTVFGCSASEVYAVGGRDVLRSDGPTWTRVDLTLTNDVNGVSCSSAGGDLVAIDGFGGLKERLVGGGWVDDSADPPFTDLHGVWADPSGAFWVAGGDFVAHPTPNKPRSGMLARYGVGTVSTSLSR